MGEDLMSRRVVAVVQARLGSTRLPGKTLADIEGRPMLAHVAERAQAIPGVTETVVATTTNPIDQAIAAFARGAGIPCVRGSEEDVLDRFRLAAIEREAEIVVRVTADCPLLDPEVAGLVLGEYLHGGGAIDYVSNVHPPTYPDGLDTEVFSRDALEVAWREARMPSDREHVTSYVWRRPERFRLTNVSGREDWSGHRWTVDAEADLAFVRAVFASLRGHRGLIGMRDVLSLLRDHPEIRDLNAGLRRNEGFDRSLASDPVGRRAAGGFLAP